MKRSIQVLSLALLLGLGVAAGGVPAVRAQEATPGGAPAEPAGVSFMPLGFAAGVTLPSPADLIAVRLSIDPGAVSPIDPNDPSGGMLLVESGTFTLVVNEQPVIVTRGAALQQAMATPTGDMGGAMETIAMGQETTISAGDVAYVPGNVSGDLRNDGQEPAVGVIFLIAPGGMMGEAPAATPAS